MEGELVVLNLFTGSEARIVEDLRQPGAKRTLRAIEIPSFEPREVLLKDVLFRTSPRVRWCPNILTCAQVTCAQVENEPSTPEPQMQETRVSSRDSQDLSAREEIGYLTSKSLLRVSRKPKDQE